MSGSSQEQRAEGRAAEEEEREGRSREKLARRRIGQARADSRERERGAEQQQSKRRRGKNNTSIYSRKQRSTERDNNNSHNYLARHFSSILSICISSNPFPSPSSPLSVRLFLLPVSDRQRPFFSFYISFLTPWLNAITPSSCKNKKEKKKQMIAEVMLSLLLPLSVLSLPLLPPPSVCFSVVSLNSIC